jgi:formate C-acetyltransferase
MMSGKNEMSMITAEFKRKAVGRVEQEKTSPKAANWTKAFFELYRDLPSRERQARAFAYALENEPVYLFEDELLTGQIYQAVEGGGSCDFGGYGFDKRWENFDSWQTSYNRMKKELPEIKALSGNPDIKKYEDIWVCFQACSPGHVGWHWDWILKEGVDGVLARVEKRLATEKDSEKIDFLKSMKISLEAVLVWSDKHLEALKLKHLEAVGKDKEDIASRIEILERVPRYSARNFREAVQAFHLSYLAVIFENPHGGNGPGRLDYYLWPYLEKDLRDGTETLESARLLIDELFIRFHERLMFRADGWVETIVVGGCDANGKSAVNPLSEIMVKSIGALNISHPSVYIRMPENPDNDFMSLAAEDLKSGGGRAQVVSDKAIIEAMTDAGISLEDARMYMCGGCMELSPHGMNGDLLFTGFFNTAKVLELMISGGKCLLTGRNMLDLPKNLSGYHDFEEFYKAFEDELRRILFTTFRHMDLTSEEFARHRPRFLLSSLIDDCIATGKGINNGGARYEDFGSTPLGIPNVGDCMLALKYAVFGDSAFISAGELLKLLKTDFKGNESIRLKLLSLPKYGQGIAEADAMTNRVLNSVCGIYNDYTNRLGGRIKPMIMTFMMAPVAGRALAASPDGRRARTPIAQGVTPQSHSMTKGLSTAMKSACKLDLKLFSGGVSNMWDLDSDFATVDNIKSVLNVFLSYGGQMFQGNTVDCETLKKAQARPEDYPDLMVRIGGYSGKFVALSREIQDEVISRKRHSLTHI